MRLRLESRICRVSSGPSGKGIWSSRKTIANLPCWRMSEASALLVTLKESMPTEPRTFSMRWQVAGSSSTISARLSMLTLLSTGRSAQCHGVQEITVHDERACLEEILEQDANRVARSAKLHNNKTGRPRRICHRENRRVPGEPLDRCSATPSWAG